MWKMIQTEWWKLRRCQILLVGIVALALCPVVQYGTQPVSYTHLYSPHCCTFCNSGRVWANQENTQDVYC